MSRTRAENKISQSNYWSRAMATTWTPERRQRQRELIQTWQPWAQSTGPRTPEGLAVASRNAFKGGLSGQLKQIRQAMRQQSAMLKGM